MTAFSEYGPLLPAVLCQIGPDSVVSHRPERYTGGGMALSIGAFEPPQQDVIRKVYALLAELITLVRPAFDSPAQVLEDVRAFVAQRPWRAVFYNLKTLTVPNDSERAHQVVHDIRGGALQALTMLLSLISMRSPDIEDIQRLFFFTRDHMKIMRNALADIDPIGQQRDNDEHMHTIGLIIEKWQHNQYRLPDSSADVHVFSTYSGGIAERCLEFSALDRMLYNLINNAARFAVDDQVYLVIMQCNIPSDTHLRFVIYNRIAPAQRAILMERYGQDVSALFLGGFTTGGNGYGMRICADFAANAYGVRTAQRAVAGGYVGARLIDDYFVAWFHWPIID